MLYLSKTESAELTQLRAACKLLGAPALQTAEQMAEWIRTHFQSSDHWWLLNSLNPVIELVTSVDSDLFRALGRSLLVVFRRLIAQVATYQIAPSSVLRELLRLNPHSLHPAESTSS
jgi:hypothetical protein